MLKQGLDGVCALTPSGEAFPFTEGAHNILTHHTERVPWKFLRISGTRRYTITIVTIIRNISVLLVLVMLVISSAE